MQMLKQRAVLSIGELGVLYLFFMETVSWGKKQLEGQRHRSERLFSLDLGIKLSTKCGSPSRTRKSQSKSYQLLRLLNRNQQIDLGFQGESQLADCSLPFKKVGKFTQPHPRSQTSEEGHFRLSGKRPFFWEGDPSYMPVLQHLQIQSLRIFWSQPSRLVKRRTLQSRAGCGLAKKINKWKQNQDQHQS